MNNKCNIIIMWIILLFIMSSCSYKMYVRPENIKTEDLVSLENGRFTKDADSIFHLPSWEKVFTDTCLCNLIELGLENNADIQIASLRVEEATSALNEARLAYLPSFALAPQGELSGYNRSATVKGYELPVKVSWEVDIAGKNTAAKRRKQSELRQTKIMRYSVSSDLIAMIANSYYTLLMLDAQLGISEKTLANWDETIMALKALKQVGKSNGQAISQAEGDRVQIELAVANLKKQISIVENSFNILLGIPMKNIERGTIDKNIAFTIPETGIPLQWLESRPDVQIAEAGLEQAFYVTAEAYASLFPSITLNGKAGWTNIAGNSISNPGTFLWNIIGSVVQPLFDRGINRTRLKIAQTRQEAVAVSFRQTLLEAGNEVNDLLTTYQITEQKSRLFEKQIDFYTEANEKIKLMMENSGNVSYLEVLAAQKSLLDTQLNETANTLQLLQNTINIYKALGGAF